MLDGLYPGQNYPAQGYAVTASASNTITQVIELLVGGGANGSGGANTYVEFDQFQAALDTSAFDGTVSYYFEADIYANAAGTTTAELYNHTDGSSVTSSQISTTLNAGETDRQRSGSLSLSGNKNYSLRVKHSTAGTNAYCYGARIIVVQSGTITKTQVQVELGFEHSDSSTSTSNRYIGNSHYLYEAAKFDGTVTVRHDAVLIASSTNTTSSGLYDETGSSIVSSSTVNTTSTSHTLVSSSAITLTDGHEYRPTVYVSAGSGVVFENNKLVFTITGSPTKFQSLWLLISGTNTSTSTSYAANTDHKTQLNTGDFSVSSITNAFESNLVSSNASGIAYASLYNKTDAAVVSGTEASISGTTKDRARSSSFSLPSVKDSGVAIKTNNALYTTSNYNSYLVNDVVLNTTPPTTQTITGKARITATTTQTVTGKARITNTTTQTQTGKARIQVTSTQTQTGKARITATTTRTQTGKARITATTTQTVTGKARVTATSTQTIAGKASIAVLGSSTQTITGKARITATTTQTTTGKARLQKTATQTITGVARVQKSATQTLTGKARVTATTTQTQVGKARVTATTTQTITGQARLQKTATQTITGKARVGIISTQTLTGKARVTATTTRTITGAGNIRNTTTRTIAGKARITGPVSSVTQTIAGVARIAAQEARGPLYRRRGSLIVGQGQSSSGGGGNTDLPNLAVITKTSTYTLTSGDSVILADCTAASFTLTLPSAVGLLGKQFAIKRINAGGNVVTIDGAGSELIDGSAGRTLNSQFSFVILVSDGHDWQLIGEGEDGMVLG